MLRRCRPLLGTYVEVTADEIDAIDAAFEAITVTHRLMSAHEPGSDVSRINRFAHEEPVEISDPTREVLERALQWRKLTWGLFDVVEAGARSLEASRIPRHVDQPAPESAQLSLVGNRARLSGPGCIDLGGIAKGYAVDGAVAAMRCAGARRGLVNAGGDLFAFGDEPWLVDVVHPQSRRAVLEIELSNEALATSAMLSDGSAEHLPDGRDWISVSVRAQNACDADALTKLVWAGFADLPRLLEGFGATALGLRANGRVESIGHESVAA
jgi:thiamine biosynthesis lipoprotein